MFRAFKQIVILIVFLVLTVFSSFYFQENENTDKVEENSELVGGIIKLVKGGGHLLEGLANFGSAVKPKADIEHPIVLNEDKFLNSNLEINNIKNDFLENIDDINTQTEKTEFQEFLNNFIRQTPKIYFDAKIYSNAWRNLWSAFNFSENWRNEQSIIQ